MAVKVQEEDDITLDDHEILDLGAKAEIILHGIRYAVLFKDIDVLRKAVVDLQDCANILDAIIEDRFESDID